MTANPNNSLLKGLDLVIDFATLGEYRLVTDLPRRPVRRADLWADDIEWTQRPRQREVECHLPRSRDRRLARSRVRD